MKKTIKILLSIIEGLLTVIVVIPVFIWKLLKLVLLVAIVCKTILLSPFWALIGWFIFLLSMSILADWKPYKLLRILGKI